MCVCRRVEYVIPDKVRWVQKSGLPLEQEGLNGPNFIKIASVEVVMRQGKSRGKGGWPQYLELLQWLCPVLKTRVGEGGWNTPPQVKRTGTLLPK